jgi:hypothetical protein
MTPHFSKRGATDLDHPRGCWGRHAVLVLLGDNRGWRLGGRLGKETTTGQPGRDALGEHARNVCGHPLRRCCSG